MGTEHGEQLTISSPERVVPSFWGKKHNKENIFKILESGNFKDFSVSFHVLKCAKGIDQHSFCKAVYSSPALHLPYPVHG